MTQQTQEKFIAFLKEHEAYEKFNETFKAQWKSGVLAQMIPDESEDKVGRYLQLIPGGGAVSGAFNWHVTEDPAYWEALDKEWQEVGISL